MDTAATRQLIDDYYAALQKGDRARLVELLAPDCEWIPPESAPLERIVGAEALADELGAEVVKRTFDLSQPFSLDIRRIVVDGSVAVVQQRLRATAKATGKLYDNQYCWVYECADGRIVRMEEYADSLLAARAMGWLD